MRNPLKRKSETPQIDVTIPNHPAYPDEVSARYLVIQRERVAAAFPALAAYKPAANSSW